MGLDKCKESCYSVLQYYISELNHSKNIFLPQNPDNHFNHWFVYQICSLPFPECHKSEILWHFQTDFFIKTFWYGPFLKSLLNLNHVCFMFWFFGPMAYRILAPWPRNEPVPPGKQSVNRWTTRKVPRLTFFT